MAGVGEEHRRRIAITLCCAGAFLVLAGIGLVIQQNLAVAQARSGPPPLSASGRHSLAQVIQGVLFLTLVLVGVFAVASIAWIRWSRHYRRRLLQKPPAPTPAEDVWSMHRLPEPAEAEPEPPPPDTPDEPSSPGG